MSYKYWQMRWEEIFRRNVQDGYAHLNSIHVVIEVFPRHAEALTEAWRTLQATNFSEESVDAFIEAYKRPMAEVRYRGEGKDREIPRPTPKQGQDEVQREGPSDYRGEQQDFLKKE